MKAFNIAISKPRSIQSKASQRSATTTEKTPLLSLILLIFSTITKRLFKHLIYTLTKKIQNVQWFAVAYIFHFNFDILDKILTGLLFIILSILVHTLEQILHILVQLEKNLCLSIHWNFLQENSKNIVGYWGFLRIESFNCHGCLHLIELKVESNSVNLFLISSILGWSLYLMN